ncbi:MAG TPA: DUF2500 family protein [Caproicibacter sp.]|nr:DUF2500 family protein [Caproicibacter sp.]
MIFLRNAVSVNFNDRTGLIIVIVMAAAVFAAVIYSFVSYHRRLQSGQGIRDEEAPVLQKYATVLQKEIVKENTGTMYRPEHRVEFRVKFRYEDGTEIDMIVPPDVYEKIPVGFTDLLITQNGEFLDFGERFGR